MEEMLKKHTIINRIVKKMNGKEALKEIIEGNTHFQLIFMDLNMPLMDGFEAILELRKMSQEGKIDLKRIKIIANSAIGKEMFLMKNESKLFDGFCKTNFVNILVEKPIGEAEIEKIIKSF